jgi:Lon protease-like protein
MSDLLPLFPLPNVVLFPNVFLPLHIFEPRYREMVADALAGDRVIGMVLLRPGFTEDYEGRPPVYAIGCSGLITHYERLADGRYNLILRGIERFQVHEEDHSRSYRRAIVEPMLEIEPDTEHRATLRRHRAKLEALLAPTHERLGMDSGPASAMSDGEVVNALAQYLDLEPLEKQALLEQSSLLTRAHSLVELLEMKNIIARAPGASTTSH